MKSFKALAPWLAAIFLLLSWLFLSEWGSERLSQWLSPWRPVGPPVGRVTELSGAMKTVRDGKVESKDAASVPFAVLSGDRLEVDANSKAVLWLHSQDEFKLGALTSLSLQLWDEKDADSPIYLTVWGGESELRKAGIKGKAYVVREGRLYGPGQKPQAQGLALTVLRHAPLDMHLADEGLRENPTQALDDLETNAEETDEPATSAIEPQTLANEYIDQTIAARQSLLQKCWLRSVKDKPELKAQLVVQMTINRRGRSKEVRVTDSSIDDAELSQCVVAVFERIQFRSFKGTEIAVSYPIQFE